MSDTRQTQYQQYFEVNYGPGAWAEFCTYVNQKPRIRPGDIQNNFPGKTGKPMTKPSYYKWEARARELGK